MARRPYDAPAWPLVVAMMVGAATPLLVCGLISLSPLSAVIGALLAWPCAVLAAVLAMEAGW